MLIVSLVVLGLASYRNLGLDFFPKVDLPTVTITTRLSGAGPEEIESQITKTIEEAVNTINGIDELRSTTIEGQSQVFVTFILEKSIHEAANDVREKVSGIVSSFPPGTDAPIIEKFDPDAFPDHGASSSPASGRPARSPRSPTSGSSASWRRSRISGPITLVGRSEAGDSGRREPVPTPVVWAFDPAGPDGPPAAERGDSRRTAHRGPPGVGLRTLGRIERVEDFNDLIVAESQEARSGSATSVSRGRGGGAADALPPGRAERRLPAGPQAVRDQYRSGRRPGQGATRGDPPAACLGTSRSRSFGICPASSGGPGRFKNT